MRDGGGSRWPRLGRAFALAWRVQRSSSRFAVVLSPPDETLQIQRPSQNQHAVVTASAFRESAVCHRDAMTCIHLQTDDRHRIARSGTSGRLGESPLIGASAASQSVVTPIETEVWRLSFGLRWIRPFADVDELFRTGWSAHESKRIA